MEEWEKNKGQGLRNFCKNAWEHSWDGEATWHSEGVHIDCCDDYYPPVMEDYGGNFEYAAKQFCEKYGFSIEGNIFQERDAVIWQEQLELEFRISKS